MMDDDQTRFNNALQALMVLFRVESTAALIEAYWVALNDLDVDDVLAGIARSMRECEFMPPPAQIRNRAGGISVERRGLLAWNSVVEAIREHGAWVGVTFDDPVTGLVVRDLGGWSAICGTNSDELHKWTRQGFLKMYAIHAARGDTPDVGLLDGLNSDGQAETVADPTHKQRVIKATKDYLEGQK